jgi:mono/diheme cytochrome c family protein
MKKRSLFGLAGGIALGALASLVLAGPAHADHSAAQKAFEANKCSNCHSVEKFEIERKIKSEKMAGPDMSKVGDKHDAAWIVKFAMREVQLDDKQHKSEYKGTKADLETIANWLATLKADS